TIPWETLDRDLTKVPIEQLQKHDQELLEGFKQLEMSNESKKKEEELKQTLRNATKYLMDMKNEMNTLTNQLNVRRKELNELSRVYILTLGRRRDHIGQIRPDNFDEKGVELSRDEDVICTDMFSVPRPTFIGKQLSPQDLVVGAGMMVLARKKDDAPEKFQKAVVLNQKEGGLWTVRFASDNSIVTIPLSAIADFESMNGKSPISSEGVRVVARTRHPCRPKDASALYSGTIISKYDIQTEQYAVAFDDSFEEYVSIHEMHLMKAQPFNQRGEWDRNLVHLLVTPNERAPGPSDERKMFLLLFFASYPEWNMVKMNEKVGKNISVLHRNGEGWVAQALKVDRHMIWLRFNPKETGFDSMQGCLDFPCKHHEHLDEKMYRGNPRLKQVRAQCDFDKALEIYRTSNTKPMLNLHTYIMKELEKRRNTRTRQEQRHQRRLHAASG
ncbi:hypothetical protein PENTCL1PPCAC_13174, partial [Pristionchus entomophagus]